MNQEEEQFSGTTGEEQTTSAEQENIFQLLEDMQEDQPAPEPKTPLGRRLVSGAFDYLELFSWAVVAVLLIFTFSIRLCRVDGRSMENTLYDKQPLLLYSAAYTPRQDDIVVFHLTHPEHDLEKILVKRVIATGGQEVVIDTHACIITVDGVLYPDSHSVLKNEDDQIIDSYYTQLFNYKNSPHDFDPDTGIFRTTVPENFVFVMGDNRNNSKDSRNPYVGFVDTRCILGKAVVRLSPFKFFS